MGFARRRKNKDTLLTSFSPNDAETGSAGVDLRDVTSDWYDPGVKKQKGIDLVRTIIYAFSTLVFLVFLLVTVLGVF